MKEININVAILMLIFVSMYELSEFIEMLFVKTNDCNNFSGSFYGFVFILNPPSVNC